MHSVSHRFEFQWFLGSQRSSDQEEAFHATKEYLSIAVLEPSISPCALFPNAVFPIAMFPYGVLESMVDAGLYLHCSGGAFDGFRAREA
jgi:hypothetical protein